MDAFGKPKPYRQALEEFSTSSDNYSIVFREKQLDEKNSLLADQQRKKKEFGGEKKELRGEENGEGVEEEKIVEENAISETEFEVAWHCPEANLGNIVFVMNFKFRDSLEWHHLRYSLQESPMRYEIENVNVYY